MTARRWIRSEAWSGAGRADASKGAGLLIQCGFVKNLRKL